MSDDVNKLVQAYQKLSTNNNELVALATLEITDLTNNPSVINSLFQIVSNPYENYIRKHAAISLKKVISEFKNTFSIEETKNIFSLILQYLSNETFEVIQNIFFNIIDILLSEHTIPILFAFIQNSKLDSLNAKLLLSLPDDHMQPFMLLFPPLVSKLVEVDINGVLLGLRAPTYFDPNFFFQIFQKGIQISVIISNDTNCLENLMKSIMQSMQYIKDKTFILNIYMPLFGVESSIVPYQSQILYSRVISELIKSISIEDTQIMFTILQKYFYLYSLIDDNDDIFDFVESFATNAEFLSIFISKINEISSSEKMLNATLLCLSYCFSANMNVYTNFNYIHDVANFLSKSVSYPSKNIRKSVGKTIQSFSMELEDNITEVCPLLVNSMIDSLNIENNDELIEALTVIFEHSCNDEKSVQLFFDKAFSFFLLKIQNKENLQHIFPSFVSLCATSRIKSHDNFQIIFDINSSIINSTSTDLSYIQEFAISGLKNLAILCSDNFSGKIGELIDYLIQVLKRNINDNDIINSILSAIGSFISKFSNDFDFTTIVQFLMNLVEKSDESSPLALSTICAIMNEYVEKVDLSSMIPIIIKSFQHVGRELGHETMILDLLRAMTIFVDYISNLSNLNDKSKSDLFTSILNWTFTILNDKSDSNLIISEAFSILIEIVDNYSFDPSFLFPIFQRIFVKEYDDDLFPTFSFLLRKLIQKGVIFDPLIPNFFEIANNSKQKEIRDFGLQILGQIAENKSGRCIDENFVKKLIETALMNIREHESSWAAFVINQIVTGCSKIPNFIDIFKPTEIMKILLECLKSDKKNASYLEFADNCVTSFAAIVIHIVKTNVPFNSYLQFILEKMPARHAYDENFEMMQFLLWIGDQTNFTPPDLFLAVLVRFFSNPIDSDVIGFIANNDDMINTLKSKLLLLKDRVDNFESFVLQICNNDQYKLHYFNQNLDI